MKNSHLEPESISAYLDGELDERARLEAEGHLSGCVECSTLRARLAGVSGRVAALPATTLTADEHRALRQAVIRARPATSSRWAFANLRWTLAGSFVLVLVAAVGLGFLRAGSPDRASDALTESAAPEADQAGPNFDFASPEEVRRTVASLPEVTAGLKRYGADDSAGAAATAGSGYAGAQEDGGAPEQFSAPAPNNVVAPTGTPGERQESRALARTDGPFEFTDEAGGACLARVAATQPYPMVPLVAHQASYQGREAWLLVFAWNPDAGAENLDRWQSWLIDPRDCRALEGEALASSTLQRSFSSEN